MSYLRRKLNPYKRSLKIVFIVLFAILLCVGVYSLFKPAVNIATKIVANNGPQIANDNGRTNILLLGVGGANHDGPNLTDTMIVASVDMNKPTEIVLISIPRDIYLNSLNNKINSAYEIGGLSLSKSVVNETTGLPIHYGVVFDFSVFEKIVDILGGIDVNVTNTLDDYVYPIDGKETDSCGLIPADVATSSAAVTDEISAKDLFPCRYEHLHFNVGLQHMDGKTALKFARSRHAEGEEGSDFARSKRQQLVIKAVKDKILSTKTFLDIGKVLSIYNQLKDNIDTDFNISLTNDGFKTALKFKDATFKSISLNQILVNPPIDYYKGWYLTAPNNDWDLVNNYIKTQLEEQKDATQSGQQQAPNK